MTSEAVSKQSGTASTAFRGRHTPTDIPTRRRSRLSADVHEPEPARQSVNCGACGVAAARAGLARRVPAVTAATAAPPEARVAAVARAAGMTGNRARPADAKALDSQLDDARRQCGQSNDTHWGRDRGVPDGSARRGDAGRGRRGCLGGNTWRGGRADLLGQPWQRLGERVGGELPRVERRDGVHRARDVHLGSGVA
jgi:hypothetical protein